MISAEWKRIDVSGHDKCRLDQISDGWLLHGRAIFQHELGPASIEYSVECFTDWRCRSGQVLACIGARDWHLDIERSERGSWSVNKSPVHGLQHCVDLDFGFTPATNFTQLRRINLEIGESADVPVAWIDLPEAALTLLPQRYERRSATAYWYEAPTAKYSALIDVAQSGFASNYPGLWQMVA